MNATVPNAPPGCRLLFQVLDTADERTARKTLCRIFGAAKGLAALLVRGTHTPPQGARVDHYQWYFWPHQGFRAYLPLTPAARGG